MGGFNQESTFLSGDNTKPVPMELSLMELRPSLHVVTVSLRPETKEQLISFDHFLFTLILQWSLSTVFGPWHGPSVSFSSNQHVVFRNVVFYPIESCRAPSASLPPTRAPPQSVPLEPSVDQGGEQLGHRRRTFGGRPQLPRGGSRRCTVLGETADDRGRIDQRGGSPCCGLADVVG